jgi:hypothetical protein
MPVGERLAASGALSNYKPTRSLTAPHATSASVELQRRNRNRAWLLRGWTALLVFLGMRPFLCDRAPTFRTMVFSQELAERLPTRCERLPGGGRAAEDPVRLTRARTP